MLLTGASGALGGVIARHLVRTHGVRSFVLAGRSSSNSPAVQSILRDLTELGADVYWESCDLSVQESVSELIQAHSPSSVIHAAGVLDDGVIGSMTAERIDRVLRPKVDAVLNLNNATRDAALSQFVVFSSIAGLFGAAGQANYAAANSAVDAIAVRRSADGVPAVSMAWGVWDLDSTLTAGLGEQDLERMARSGVRPLTVEEGLRAFDDALISGLPVVAPADIFASATDAGAPQLLRALVRGGSRRPASTETEVPFTDRIGALARDARPSYVLELVTTAVAQVLGQSPGSISERKSFQDIGFDSLTAVELRNRLHTATGLTLGAGLVFDYPNPQALAAHLLDFVGQVSMDAVIGDLDRIERRLTEESADDASRAEVLTRLERLMARLSGAAANGHVEMTSDANDLSTSSDEELFEMLGKNYGIS